MTDVGDRNPLETHALMLLRQGRHAEAEGKFREALQGNPLDARLLHFLAFCQYLQDGGEARAVITIRDAIAQQPEASMHHALYAQILADLGRAAEARTAAEQAIALDPFDADAHNAMTYVLLHAEKWAEAEASARRALALDADDASAANHLATALRLQNKMAENAAQIEGMLARDPEDCRTHATAGWAALQSGRHADAERHFLESLRLQPGYTPARDGLLEAFKARSPTYRAYQSWCFFMQRLDRGQRWAVIIGLYLLNRFSRVLFTGRMAPVGIAVTVLYLAFALWTFLARGVGGLLLLRDRFARHVLTREEKVEALTVGGTFVSGLVLVAVGAVAGFTPLTIWGGAGIIAAVPLSMVFRNESLAGRIFFGAIGAYCLAIGLPLGVALFLQLDVAQSLESLALWGLLAVAASTWLSNVPFLHRSR